MNGSPAGPGYRTIVADPPWDYGSDHGRWPTMPTGGGLRRSAIPYDAMGAGEIADLAVHELALPDARLFLWTTNRHLPQAFSVIGRWGFTYRQTLVWHKTGNPAPFGGSVAPVHAEFLLVATRGKPALSERLASSVIPVPAVVSGHSRKPDAFLDLIERISPGPYVELFARRARFGWDYWGDESLQTAQMAA